MLGWEYRFGFFSAVCGLKRSLAPMARFYSSDLRERIAEMVNDRLSAGEAAGHFGASPSSCRDLQCRPIVGLQEAASIAATTLNLDIRYVVTSLALGGPAWLYHACGQAENLADLHKGKFALDRMRRRSALTHHACLVPNTFTFWLMMRVRDTIPTPCHPPVLSSRPLRLNLLGIAAHMTETATRVHIALATVTPKPQFSAESQANPASWILIDGQSRQHATPNTRHF